MVKQVIDEILDDQSGGGGGSGAGGEPDGDDWANVNVTCDRYAANVRVGTSGRGWPEVIFFPADGNAAVEIAGASYEIGRVAFACSDNVGNSGDDCRIVGDSLYIERALPGNAFAGLLQLAQSVPSIRIAFMLSEKSNGELEVSLLRSHMDAAPMGPSGSRPTIVGPISR